jgi:hypothetical protein
MSRSRRVRPADLIAGPKADKRVKYAYVILAMISVLTAFIAVQISLAAIRGNNHNFCDLTHSLTVTPPVKNHINVAQYNRSLAIYNELIGLQRHLGC